MDPLYASFNCFDVRATITAMVNKWRWLPRDIMEIEFHRLADCTVIEAEESATRPPMEVKRGAGWHNTLGAALAEGNDDGR